MEIGISRHAEYREVRAFRSFLALAVAKIIAYFCIFYTNN